MLVPQMVEFALHCWLVVHPVRRSLQHLRPFRLLKVIQLWQLHLYLLNDLVRFVSV